MNTIETKNNNGFLENLYAVLIILSTSLFLYQGFGSMRMAEVLLILVLSLVWLKKGLILSLSTYAPLLLFIVVEMFLTVCSIVIQGQWNNDVLIRITRNFLYVFYIIIAGNYVNAKQFLKILRVVTILVCVYVLLQVLAYYTLGIMLPNDIFPFKPAKELDVSTFLEKADQYYFRPYGIFSEPSAVAKFLFPGLCFSLFGWDENKRVDIKLVILIEITLIITTSLQAFFVSATLIIYYLITKGRADKAENKRKNGTIPAFAILIVVAALFYILFKLNLLDNIIARINEFSDKSATAGSSNALRIYRGFAVYNELPFLYKAIGVGHGNIGNFAIMNNIYTQYDHPIRSLEFLDYVNGASMILLYSGIIGAIFFIVFYFRLFKNSSYANKAILIAFMLMQFSGGGMFAIVMTYYFPIVFICLKSKKEVEYYEIQEY